MDGGFPTQQKPITQHSIAAAMNLNGSGWSFPGLHHRERSASGGRERGAGKEGRQGERGDRASGKRERGEGQPMEGEPGDRAVSRGREKGQGEKGDRARQWREGEGTGVRLPALGICPFAFVQGCLEEALYWLSQLG